MSAIENKTDINLIPTIEHQADTHRVFITDLLLNMLIGVYQHEKLKEQPVRINVTLTVQDHAGPMNDDYHNVVCYETIANRIKKLVKEEHINLVETLAERITHLCFENQRVRVATVKVEKLQALSDAGSVGVEITRFNKQQ